MAVFTNPFRWIFRVEALLSWPSHRTALPISAMALHKRNIPIELLRRSNRLPKPTNIMVEGNSGGTEEEKIPESKPVKRIKREQISTEIVEKNEGLKFDSSANVKAETKSCDTSTPTKDDSPPEGFLEVHADELDLERTLLGGQSFRWTKEESKGELVFTGVVLDRVLRIWRTSPNRIAYKTLNKVPKASAIECPTNALLEDYFQLKYNLRDLYREWSAKDPHLGECCQQYKGFRILRQDPVENVFSFICATNNNIKRISQMVDKLCKRYGNILEPTCESCNKQSIYDLYQSFPSVERLAEEDVFQSLRYELGFGYRAKFITGTAKQLLELSEANKQKSVREYLLSLRQLPYKDTCKTLMKFQGIGRKVADCICLMSMDHLNAVPIDCHIYEIVVRHYMPNLRNEHKTLTENVHDLIGDYFKSMHGPLAGWSTSVLFIAELKHLKLSEKPIKKVSMKTKAK